jgi:hypothetical protein
MKASGQLRIHIPFYETRFLGSHWRGGSPNSKACLQTNAVKNPASAGDQMQPVKPLTIHVTEVYRYTCYAKIYGILEL